jgi:hypothetical protein
MVRKKEGRKTRESDNGLLAVPKFAAALKGRKLSI